MSTPTTTPVQTQPDVLAAFAGQIGVARRDITPPAGIFMRNWGAARHDVANSIHRPLSLTALTLESKTCRSPLVLIEADLGWWQSQSLWQTFHTRLLAELELEPSALVVCVSHTHSGPPLTEPEPGLPGGELLAAWLEKLAPIAIDAVCAARREATEATLDWHAGRCRLAAVRDLPEPGAQRFLCGYNPELVADDTLVVGRVVDRHGKLRATVTNYACHPTTLAWENTAISPDYVGAMRETIESVTGAPALFLQGASGELAPKHQYVADLAVADQHGQQLGFATLATLRDMGPPATRLQFAGVVESGAPLAVYHPRPLPVSDTLQADWTTVDLPLKPWPSAAELERQRAECPDRALRERLRRRRDIRRAVGDSPFYRLPIWVWQLGEAVLVGCRAEAYSELQRQLRTQFPDRIMICVNLLNGSLGYLPPADRYDQDIYQVWQTPFARGSLETTIAAMGQAVLRKEIVR